MLLPHTINALLAQTKGAEGSPFVRLNTTRLTIPYIAANTATTLDSTPNTGIYGLLAFRISFSDVPMSMFSLDVYHRGALLYTGPLSTSDLVYGLDFLTLIRTQYPLSLALTNNDVNNAQAFDARVHYLVIDTLEEWEAVVAYLKAITGQIDVILPRVPSEVIA